MLGNRIGTDRSGTQALGNGQVGVLIDSAVSNTIGGTAPGAGNLISANRSTESRLAERPPTPPDERDRG